jgi:hypothetical protein
LLAIEERWIIIQLHEQDPIKEWAVATAVECEHCGQRYSVREDLLGKRMKCKACGKSTAIVAAAPRPKRPAEAGASEKRPLGSPAKPHLPRKPAAPAKAKSTEPGALKPARTTPARPGTPHTQRAPAPTVPSGALTSAAPPGTPAAAPAPNLLDDAAFSAADSTPLSAGVVLKASAPTAVEKPKAKKKKKKKNDSGELSDNTRVLLRMAGGAVLVLLGLLAIGRAVYAIVSRDDENAAIGFLVGRWIVGGVSSISGGIKLICG